MRQTIGPLLFTTILLLIPAVPFLLFGEELEQLTQQWIDRSPPPSLTVLAVILALSTDVFLPIPSSFISTYAAMQLPLGVAVAASWFGMTLGASIGFVLARWFGRPLLIRWSKPGDVDRLDAWSARLGVWLLVLTRALPLFAETTVLLLGAARLSWTRFLLAVSLSNLGIAVAYSLLGFYGEQHGAEFYALLASIALPVATATITRIYFRTTVHRARPRDAEGL